MECIIEKDITGKSIKGKENIYILMVYITWFFSGTNSVLIRLITGTLKN